MDESFVTEDERVSSDQRTMLLIKRLGDDIHSSIQLEVDYPSNHRDQKLPILDLKVWLETREKEIENQVVNMSVIKYELYSKEMVSKPVINARSALSWSTKRTVLTHEVLRVLLNCRKLLPWERWERVVENVTEMVLRMQYSGYSEKFRCDVVNTALKAYETSKKAYREGERPLHRPRELKREERDQEKVRKRSNWYKKGRNEVVVFVPSMPNSQLPRRYQKEIKKQGFKIKVVEKAGAAIKKLLQRSDPFKSRKCERGIAQCVEKMEK